MLSNITIKNKIYILINASDVLKNFKNNIRFSESCKIIDKIFVKQEVERVDFTGKDIAWEA